MAARGHDIGGSIQDNLTKRFNYAVPGAAEDDGTFDYCYYSEFQKIDAIWQTDHPSS